MYVWDGFRWLVGVAELNVVCMLVGSMLCIWCLEWITIVVSIGGMGLARVEIALLSCIS